MSLEMRLLALSELTAGSDEFKPLAVSLSGRLGFCGATGAATTSSYVIPPSGVELTAAGGELFTRGIQRVLLPWR
jgi:hypothetical protein